MGGRARVALRVAAATCAVGAAIAAVAARPVTPAAAEPHNGTPAPPTATPLWSARRVPTLFAAAIQRARAERELTDAISGTRACVAVDDASLGPTINVGTRDALTPASAAKLLVAAAALVRLGPSYRFATVVRAGPSADTIVLVGGGDPLLASGEYEAQLREDARFRDEPVTELSHLADALAGAGVREVHTILVDDARDDEQRALPDWKPNYARDGEIGSLGALTSDAGFVDADHHLPAADPAIATGRRLATLLEARGARIDDVRHGSAPAGARDVARVQSATVASIVSAMLTASDNYVAEELTREIAAATGEIGTTPRGVALVHDTVAALGVPLGGVVMHDGSGLAPDDRVTCAALLALVELSRTARFAAIDRGLAVAGRTGTLAASFRGDPLAGRLRAKTGSLDGVVALAGVVDGRDDPRFAFVANGAFTPSEGDARRAVVAHIVAEPFDPLGASAVVPAP